jgi:hypothetical protein
MDHTNIKNSISTPSVRYKAAGSNNYNCVGGSRTDDSVLGLETHLEVGVPSTALTDPEAQLRYCEISIQRPNDPPVQGVTIHQKLHLSATHGHRNLVPRAVGQAKRKRLHFCRCFLLYLIMIPDLVFTAAGLQLQVPVKEKVRPLSVLIISNS